MINKLIKYTVSTAILTTMIQATPTFASPVDSPPVTQGQIDATKEQISDFETRMQQLDNRIALAIENSQKLNNDIKTQQGKIEETASEIENAKKSLDTHKEVYSERLKSIQLDGKESIATYAELLLSSNNISEFLTRFTAISKIMESDTELLNGLNEKEQALETSEQKLHNEIDQLKKSQEELVSEQKKIEEDKKAVEIELANAKDTLQNQEALQNAQLAQQEAERQAQLAQQEAERQAQLAQQQSQQQSQQQQSQQQQTQQQPQQRSQQQSQQSSPVSNNAAVKAPSAGAVDLTNLDAANKVIAYAKQFLGVPYVWGGSTPSGFDCSGFTSYVYRSIGINLPRVSRDQQNVGTRISPNQVQPGDLVFRGNPAYHVGIYIGGGQYIHAPQTGDVVKIASYNPSKFSSAARILR